jgi:cell division protein FtsZ
MQASGLALMGTGTATGENRAIEAAQKAISSPLLEGMDIRGAKAMLVNITASSNLLMHEVEDGMATIQDAAGEDVNVIFGLVEKEEMKDYLSFTVIATGFDTGKANTRPVQTEKQVENVHVPQTGIGSFNAAPAPVKPVSIPQFPMETINRIDDLNTPSYIRDQFNSTYGTDTQTSDQKAYDFKESKQDNVQTLKFKSNPNSVAKEDDEDQSASFLRMIMD